MSLVPLSLLGGLVGLDGTSLGQFMVSRPIVAATAAGWVLGDPVNGLVVGTILELLHVSVLAVGGARFPEVGPGAVVGAATAVLGGGPGGVALGCMMALVWGQIGGVTIVTLRRLNGMIAPDSFDGPVTPLRAELLHLASLGIDLARGTVVTAAGILLSGLWVTPAAPIWPLEGEATLGLLFVGAGLAAGALLKILGGARRQGVLFGVGVLAGVLAGALL